MPNFGMLIEYDGAAFHGWQEQPERRTVQSELEGALALLLRQPVRILGAGRTDSGVHASGQVANFRVEWGAPLRRGAARPGASPESPISDGAAASQLHWRLEQLLPGDLAVRAVTPVPESFDARRSAVERRYRYRIRRRRSPLNRHREWVMPYALDRSAIETLFDVIRSHDDFRAFTRVDCELPSYDVDLHHLAIERVEGGFDVVVWARRFLHNMIRILAGTVVEVGRGKIEPEAVHRALVRRDRRLVGPTAPPQGLCLEAVIYPSLVWPSPDWRSSQ